VSPAIPFRSEDELDALVAAFEALTLPKVQWTHAMHVTIGGCFYLRHGEAGALARLRPGIRRLNESHGVVNSDTHGYHESLTRLWIALIARFLDEYRALHPRTARAAAIQALAESFGHRSRIFKEYWTSDVTSSREARALWQPPDALPPDIAVLDCDSPLGWESARSLLTCYAADLPPHAAAGVQADAAHAHSPYPDARTALLLARAREGSIGCIALRELESSVGEIKRLYVTPEHRRRGTARLLMNAALARARRLGLERVRLGTLAEMAPAQALYRRLGFAPVAAYPGSDPVDELWFELRLIA